MSKSAPATDTIAGRYRVSGRIAGGGMGEVLRAVDTVLRRTVAIKILPPDLASRSGFVDRFRSEARSAARLNHPGVVQVYDWGETGTTYFMVMEYVRGKNLRQILAERGALAQRQACEVIAGVLDALQAAHDNGIVHRDVKPENVMISVEGKVKVADLGLARVADKTTQTGGLIGTVAYVAPEQARGEPTDARTDIYSTGCVMYELLTGSPPFEGDAAQVLNGHLNSRVPEPSIAAPAIGPEVDRIVIRATQPDPGARYGLAAEMKAEVESALVSSAPSAPLAELSSEVTREAPADSMDTVAPASRKHRRRWPLIAAAAFVAITLAAAAVLHPARVPDVAGAKLAAAQVRLQKSGLQTVVRRVYSDESPGTVIETRPASGGIVFGDQSVMVVVSIGPRTADLPDLVGKSLEEAKSLVGRAGLAIGEVTRRHDAAAANTVISQDPEPGKVRGGTPVNLVVSDGPEMVEVPDVKGRSFEEASSMLTGAGLNTVRQDTFNDAAVGVVLDQDPKGGASVQKGSAVTLTVSKGPEPFAMPDVRNRPCSEAKATLESKGLTVAINSKSHAQCGSNKVLDQDPLPGATVRKGQEATLYLA